MYLYLSLSLSGHLLSHDCFLIADAHDMGREHSMDWAELQGLDWSAGMHENEDKRGNEGAACTAQCSNGPSYVHLHICL